MRDRIRLLLAGALLCCGSLPATAAELGDPCSTPGELYSGDDGGGPIHLFCEAGTWQLGSVLQTDGPLGIGDPTPDGDLLLDVQGKVGATDYCDEDGNNCFNPASGLSATAAGAEGAVQFNSSSALGGASTFVYKSATGRVGIGTGSPTGTLHVYNAADSEVRVTSNSGGFARTLYSATNGYYVGEFGTGYFYITDAAGNPALAIDSNERAWFRQGLGVGATYFATLNPPANGLIVQGYVGIGNSSPSQMLTVGPGGTANVSPVLLVHAGTNAGSNDTGAVLRFARGNVGYWDIGLDDGSAHSNSFYLYSYEKAGGPARVVSVSADGNVGIGTSSPAAMLQVNAGSAVSKGTLIRAAASQTANLLEMQDSTGAVRAFVSPGQVQTSSDNWFYALKPGNRDYRMGVYDAAGAIVFSREDATDNGFSAVLNSSEIVLAPVKMNSKLVVAGGSQGLILTPYLPGGTGLLQIGRRYTDDSTGVGASTQLWTNTGQVLPALVVKGPGGSGDLMQIKPNGELWGLRYCDTTGSSCFNPASGITASAAGAEGAIQFNNSSALGGASTFVYQSATGRVGIGTTTLTVNTVPLKLGVLGSKDLTNGSGGGGNQLGIIDDAAFAQGVGGALNLFGKYRGDGGLDQALGAVIDAYKANATTLDYGFDLRFHTRTNGDPTVNEHMRITSTGNVGIGTASPGSQLQVNASSAATKGLIIRGASSQSANLTEWQDSGGNSLASVSSNGTISAGTSSNATRLYYTSGQGFVDVLPITSQLNYRAGAHRMERFATSHPYLITGTGLGFNIRLASEAASEITLIAKGAAAQSANLTEWQNSAGTALAFVNASGGMNAASYCDAAGANCFNPASGIASAASGPEGAIQFNSSSSLSSKSTFVYNSAAGWVGIGTSSPSGTLDVRFDSSHYALINGKREISFPITANGYFYNNQANDWVQGIWVNNGTKGNGILVDHVVNNGDNAGIYIRSAAKYGLNAESTAAGTIPLFVKADDAQTANLTEWQNSGGTALG